MTRKKKDDPGIYCIENIENGKQYIGKGNDVELRMWQSHIGCTYIDNAIKKHGKNIFKRFIVEHCEKDNLVEREQYYIKEWNTKVPNGYNLTDGGDGGLGITEETIKKKHQYSGKNHWNFGRHSSNETRRKQSIAHTGIHHISNDKKKEMSENEMGRKNHAFATKKKNATSKYYGVSWHWSNPDYKTTGRWVAQIRVRGINIIIGRKFINEIDAARAYDKYVVEHNIDHPLNFPLDK
jgi:group I intron endonuclease